MDGGDRILMAAGVTAAVVVGAFVLWGPAGAPRVRKRRGQIAGLHNLGRTCFLNTLLQALAASPQFIEWLKKYATTDSNNSMTTTLYTVIEVVNGTHASARGTAVCPLGVLQALRCAGWVLPPEQHDAHELLHALLACLDDERAHAAKKPGCLSDALGLGAGAWSALASPSSPPARAPRADSAPRTPAAAPRPARPASAAPPDCGEPELADDSREEPVGRLPRKGVSRSFCQLSSLGRRWVAGGGRGGRVPAVPPCRGSLASRLQCTVCGNKTPVRYDKFDSISLSLSSASVGLTGNYALTGLLRAFTAPELVADVQCSQCHAPNFHLRTTSVGKLPSCLWLHISRVEWHGSGAIKRAEHVAFPPALDMAPYAGQAPPPELSALLSSPALRAGPLNLPCDVAGAGAGGAGAGGAGGPRTYRLVAAVVHVGGPRSGHFATYRRGNGFEANRWWYTSDTLVHEVTLQEVLRCSAYMLFYEKIPLDEPLMKSQHF